MYLGGKNPKNQKNYVVIQKEKKRTKMISSQLPTTKQAQIELYTTVHCMMNSNVKCTLRRFGDQWLQSKSEGCLSRTRYNLLNLFWQLFYSCAVSNQYINACNKMWTPDENKEYIQTVKGKKPAQCRSWASLHKAHIASGLKNSDQRG